MLDQPNRLCLQAQLPDLSIYLSFLTRVHPALYSRLPQPQIYTEVLGDKEILNLHILTTPS